MKKKLAAIIALFLAMVMALPMGITPVLADDAEPVEKPVAKAFFMFADSAWANQKWNADDTDPVVDGDGTYTISYTCEEGFDNFAFAAIGIENGEIVFPGATIEIKSIKINDKDVNYTKGYTSSDDGVVTRMNIYNEWVTELPADARSFDGKIDDATPFIIDNKQAGVKKVEITFAFHVPTAYIMFSEPSNTISYWNDGNEVPETLKVSDTPITGPGDYSVKIESATPFDNLQFLALGITYGEVAFPAGCIELKAVKINGTEVETKVGYTSSDDGIVTRMNLFNEWVADVPEDARGYGDISEATPTVISNQFAGITSIEVDFTYHIPYTFLMYADTAWANQYCGDFTKDEMVNGEGEYTVKFELPTVEEVPQTFDGLAFLAIGIQDAEKIFPGYTIELKSVKVNGEKYEVTGKGYTSSDDGVTTRMNLYNEWVSAVPADARSFDGNIDEVSPTIVSKDLTGVNKIEVTYVFAPDASSKEPEIDTFDYEGALKQSYNAYIMFQTAPGYSFRNTWFEANYGMNADGDYFSHITGWDADNNAANYGGKFTDVAITGDGTYKVSMDIAEGETGIADQEGYNYLGISTNIPYKLIDKGYVEITDVKTSFDGGASREFTYVTSERDGATKTDYAVIYVLSTYVTDVGAEAIPYVMAQKNITISFTVKGLKGEKAAEPEATPTPASEAPTPTTAPSEAPAENAGIPVWVWGVVAGVVLLAAVVVIIAVSKKKKK